MLSGRCSATKHCLPSAIGLSLQSENHFNYSMSVSWLLWSPKLSTISFFSNQNSIKDDSIECIPAHVQVGITLQGPWMLRCFGLNVMQHEDISISAHGHEKGIANKCQPLSSFWRRNEPSALDFLELKSFTSANCNFGWLDSIGSGFCA